VSAAGAGAAPALVVCADWSAALRRRRAWAGDVVERSVFPLAGRTVDGLLGETSELLGPGDAALVCFDAPLGLPRAFLQAAGFCGFLDWLERADLDAAFAPVTRAAEWSVARPFIRPARGEWTALVAAAPPRSLLRDVDVRVQSESVFKLVGAKQVGRAAQELWRELRAARAAGREFRIWPFEAPAARGVTIAEIYPRLAYGRALVKSNARVRASALAELDPRIRLLGQVETEDDFDAAVTAVALLQRLLAGLPLSDGEVDDVAEGAILLG
jgi:hypothetical protein